MALPEAVLPEATAGSDLAIRLGKFGRVLIVNFYIGQFILFTIHELSLNKVVATPGSPQHQKHHYTIAFDYQLLPYTAPIHRPPSP